MAKNIKWLLMKKTEELDVLATNGIIVAVPCGDALVVARHGVNKTSLEKIAAEELTRR